MSFQYSLTIVNHASHSAYFMVFQNDPGSFDPNAKALAWFSKFSNPAPTATVKFTWTVDWGFSWAETGKLERGVVFEASEKADIGPGKNMIALDYNGAYIFANQTAGPDPNRFYIAESKDIPVASEASVGITMSGSTVYAAQAMPNYNITASPHPVYYVAYGEYLPGEVIDVSSINNPLALPYDTGVYSLSTVLNPDNSWDQPLPTAARNEQFLAARKNDPKLHWTRVGA